MVRKWITGRISTWEADDKKAFLVLVGGFFLLVFSAVWGELVRMKESANGWETAAGERAVQEYLPQEDLAQMILPKEHTEFLQQIEQFMAGASIHQAAERLAEESDRIREIGTIVRRDSENETIYIGKGEIAFSLNGMGLAVRADGTCFYGNFREGKPDGVCTAIACVDSEPGDDSFSGAYKYRYTYSMGIWKNGQMEGLGITGRYVYPGGRKGQDSQGLEEQVSGIFQGDRMDGWLTYEQIDRQGRSCWWEIGAEEGKICLDQRWLFQQTMREYRLLSERDGRAFFVVPENLLERVWWKNQVPWYLNSSG